MNGGNIFDLPSKTSGSDIVADLKKTYEQKLKLQKRASDNLSDRLRATRKEANTKLQLARKRVDELIAGNAEHVAQKLKFQEFIAENDLVLPEDLK